MRFLIKFIVGFEKERYTIGESEKYIEVKKGGGLSTFRVFVCILTPMPVFPSKCATSLMTGD